MENLRKNKNMLIIRNLPPQLSSNEITELLRRFGSDFVRVFANYGRMKNIAFAHFYNSQDAGFALKELHQLQLLDRYLRVEFCNERDERNFHLTTPLTEELLSNYRSSLVRAELFVKNSLFKYNSELNGISSRLNFSSKPLSYKYPCSTKFIIKNIAKLLQENEIFYTQVLHLMNKMNLPPPFVQVPANKFKESAINNQGHSDFDISKIELPPDHPILSSSSEESELESEDEEKINSTELPKFEIKTKQKCLVPPNKRSETLLKSLKTNPLKRKKPLDVVQLKSVILNKQKKIKVNIDSKTLPDARTESIKVTLENSGFGVKQRVNLSDSEEVKSAVDEEVPEIESFISKEDLLLGKIRKEDYSLFPILNNYSEGNEGLRLYVKNIAKTVNQADLNRIFGHFVNWKSEEERNAFDIRLMQSGRMKGQAFVSYSRSENAKLALKLTHTFMLKGKPLIVMFANSCKRST